MNHIVLLEGIYATIERQAEVQEKLNFARVIAHNDQAIQLELDRQQEALDATLESLEYHMTVIPLSN